MIANAWHHRADAVSSVVTLIGVGKEFQLFVKTPFSIYITICTPKMVFVEVSIISTGSCSLLVQVVVFSTFFYFILWHMTHAIHMCMFNLSNLCINTLINSSIFILGGSILGMKFLDPLAGLVVSGMILKAGLATGYQRCIFCPQYISSFCLLFRFWLLYPT